MAQARGDAKSWAVYKCPSCGLGNFRRTESEERGACGRCGASLADGEQTSPITVEGQPTRPPDLAPEFDQGPPREFGSEPREYAPTGSLAGLGRRFVARFVDSIIINISLIILTGILGGSDSNRRIIVYICLGVAFVVGSELVLIALRGQTIGKAMLRVKVVKEETYEIPGWGPAGRRLLIQMIPLVNIINPLWAIWDPRNQALHDKAAKTLVIDAEGS